MRIKLLLLVLLITCLKSCSNKPINSYLHRYEQVIDCIIAGYDSKDVEEAQYRIASSFGIVHDIIGDTLVSKSDKKYLADKIEQAESTWCANGSGMFSKVTFITGETGDVVGQVDILYWDNNEMDSIAIMKIWVPEEVDSIYLTLANWEIDSVKDIYSSSPMPLERGCFISRLKPYNQEMLLQRNTLFIDGYTAKDDSLYLHVAIPLKILHKQLQEWNNE